MPQLIDSIDAIARQKGRGVLCLRYRRSRAVPLSEELDDLDPFAEYKWEDNPARDEIIEWLETLGIAWLPCAPMVGVDSLFDGYFGDIYIDIPFDENNAAYKKLSAFLQDDADGWCRFPGVAFGYLPLETAMKRASTVNQDDWE